MEKFELNILGCGAALPTSKHHLSGQVINLRGNLYMIDCGEGTQMKFREMKLNFTKLNHIFISHLHGDHCFGLLGMVSSMGLLGRSTELHIHAQPDAQKIFQPLFQYFCKELPYSVLFHSFDPYKNELIFENHTLRVYTIPLKHRVPTAGFLFEEKPKSAHIIQEMTDFYQVPISQMKAIKEGADFVTAEGEIIPNCQLTRSAELPHRYAYCSDTAYREEILSIIEGVDLLYHEATFCHEDVVKAEQVFHSSALQAALIAQKARAKRLILGHFSARYPDESLLLKEAQSLFPETLLAHEKMLIHI